MPALLAAIDIGTHSVIALVARPEPDGTITELREQYRVTRGYGEFRLEVLVVGGFDAGDDAEPPRLVRGVQDIDQLQHRHSFLAATGIDHPEGTSAIRVSAP